MNVLVHEKLTILVADDEEVNRILLEELLSTEGHNVLTATNGKEALEIAQTGTVDCFVMDVNMPVMNGIEAFKEIRADKRYADAAFVFITGNPDIPGFQKIMKCKHVEYVQKPFELPDIYQALQRHRENR